MRMNKIMKIHTKYYRNIAKSKYLLIMICLFYLLVIVSNITEVLLNKSSIYMNMMTNVFHLVVFSFVYLIMQKKSTKQIEPKRKMNILTFVSIISLINVVNLVFSSIITWIYSLNAKGVAEIPGAISSFSLTSLDKIIDFIIISPIIEELIFRGAGLRLFNSEDNKIEAIIFTSIIFGLMHANLLQALGGTFIGFILGYVAIEYGIMYSMIFHMAANGLANISHFGHNVAITIEVLSLLILLWWILNKVILTLKQKNNLSNFNFYLTSVKNYSIKRQLSYFLNPILLFFIILWIIEIILSI